eukprot:271196-Pleurochrysis_carterae.AAC.1
MRVRVHAVAVDSLCAAACAPAWLLRLRQVDPDHHLWRDARRGGEAEDEPDEHRAVGEHRQREV